MKIVLLILMSTAAIHSQEKGGNAILTGNLRYDLFAQSSAVDSAAVGRTGQSERHKSPLRAAVYSALLPGAGEFYAEEYWRAGAFLGAEVLLWTVYAVYNSRGGSQTEEFERYGDSYWSVVDYAVWIENYGPSLNPNSSPPPTGIVTSSDQNLPPWERVNWNLLNAWEEFIGGFAPTGFSHRLPKRPDQQYYELIGKYLQYNVGWSDWNPNTSSGYLDGPTNRFSEYRDMRGRANDLYTIARTATYILVVNHLVSAFDAALSAGRFNQSVRMEAHIIPTQRSFGFVEFVPTAVFTLTF